MSIHVLIFHLERWRTPSWSWPHLFSLVSKSASENLSFLSFGCLAQRCPPDAGCTGDRARASSPDVGIRGDASGTRVQGE